MNLKSTNNNDVSNCFPRFIYLPQNKFLREWPVITQLKRYTIFNSVYNI